MYLCTDCGRTFAEEKHYAESHGFDRPPYEEWDGCPYCGGNYVEAKDCENCGKTVNADDLYDGYCEDCLRELCTYDSALDYLQAYDLLGNFCCWYFNEGHEPDAFTLDLTDVFADIYRQRKTNDLLLHSTEWLDAVREYILDADGRYGKDEFAKFLMEGSK